MHNIQWIFFDIGSTLVDEEKSHRERIRRTAELARKYGRDIDEDTFYREMKSAAESNFSPYVTVCDKLGVERVKYPSEFDEPYADAEKVLSQLHEHYKIGIIANQPLGSNERLERYGLLRYIDVGCYSGELGVSKPSEGIFRDALYKAACKTEKAVMVGDRPDNDIYPAKKIGMKTVRLISGLHAAQKPLNSDYEADYTINRLSGLVGLFGRGENGERCENAD